MSEVEIIAVIFSLTSVYFSAYKKVYTWPAGMIGVTAYGWLFYKEKLYADTFLQIIFFIQCIYGWYYWRADKEEKDFKAKKISNKWRIIAGLVVAVLTVILGFMLQTYTDASLPWLDAFLSVSSLTANFLATRKFIENWILWIMADIFYIGLFLYKSLYLSSVVYVIFIVLCVKGIMEWKKAIT